MLKWAKRLTHGGSNAEDLVQAAMVNMLAYRNRAPSTLADIDPWARVVLLNVFRQERRRQRPTVSLDDVLLIAPDNPERQTYCRQVVRIALGIDADMLLAEPLTPETATERTRRRRARLELQRIAA
jgi:DNA-directed RNA polymerase specialized sigma24 family protein